MGENENELTEESSLGEPQQLSEPPAAEFVPEEETVQETAENDQEYIPAPETTESIPAPPENVPDENLSRAERIKAIRQAIRQREEEEANAAAPAQTVADKAAMIHRAIAEKQQQNAPPPAMMPPPPPPPQRSMPPRQGAGAQKKSGGKKKKKKKTFWQSFRGLFPERGDSVKERIRKLIFLGSVAAIIVCGYMVADYELDLFLNRSQNNSISDLYHTYDPGVSEEEPEETDEDTRFYSLMSGAKKLLDINPDVIGYMTIPTIDGDPIVDIPVVQAQDNSKYLDINFKGEDSRAGALFLDYRNSFDRIIDHKRAEKDSDHLIVYGHNMGDDSMFGSLKYYERNQGVNYYENHPIIQFNSNYDTYTYKIFAFFILDALDETSTEFDIWNKLNFDDEEDFYNFVNEAKRRTIRTNDVDVKYGDQILSLSTCNTLLGDRGRLIIMARKVRTGEDPYEGTQHSEANTNIKWPTMYYNTRTNEKYDPEAEFVPYGPDPTEKKEAEEANE
ncbi:MAG: class B sortase [Ruminococcus sp.]|jgi:sortase B|nr:class B sortase [Ruminococcus sp.]